MTYPGASLCSRTRALAVYGKQPPCNLNSYTRLCCVGMLGTQRDMTLPGWK